MYIRFKKITTHKPQFGDVLFLLGPVSNHSILKKHPKHLSK